MTMEEHNLRRAIHDTCRAIFLAYEREASTAEINELMDALGHLNQHAAAIGLGFQPLLPFDLWKPK
jgi:hypothetical protein